MITVLRETSDVSPSLSLERINEAKVEFETAIRLSPLLVTARLNLGNLLLNVDNVTVAERNEALQVLFEHTLTTFGRDSPPIGSLACHYQSN